MPLVSREGCSRSSAVFFEAPDAIYNRFSDSLIEIYHPNSCLVVFLAAFYRFLMLKIYLQNCQQGPKTRTISANSRLPNENHKYAYQVNDIVVKIWRQKFDMVMKVETLLGSIFEAPCIFDLL